MAVGNSQHRVVINTVISLTGSCFAVFILTPFIRSGKLHAEDVLNATLAGGVIVGACSDLVLNVWASLMIGAGGGTISLLGFEFLGPYLLRTIGLHDTCGIHNLHGIPGFLGGIIGAISAGTANFSALETVCIPSLLRWELEGLSLLKEVIN